MPNLVPIIAIVLLIFSVAWAIYFKEVSAVVLALWAIAVMLILPAFVK